MNKATLSRGLIYIAGIGAGGLALAGLADFDPATFELDIHPFNVREAVLTAITTGGNILAGIAVWRGWGKK